MNDLLNRIVFHPDHGYGMITSDELSFHGRIKVRYEDGYETFEYHPKPPLVILPRFGEKIKMWDDENEEPQIEIYIGYEPQRKYSVVAKGNQCKHFAFIDEEPTPGKATDQVINALKVLNEYFKED